MLEPPDNVHIAEIRDGQAILEWRPAAAGTACINYRVTSNCSTCSIVSNSATASCTIPQMSLETIVCAFRVQSVVCGNLTGRPGTPVVFTFPGI